MVESPRIAGRAAPPLSKQDGTQESRQSHLKRSMQSQQLVKCSFSIILLLCEFHDYDTDKYSRTLGTKTWVPDAPSGRAENSGSRAARGGQRGGTHMPHRRLFQALGPVSCLPTYCPNMKTMNAFRLCVYQHTWVLLAKSDREPSNLAQPTGVIPNMQSSAV